MGKNISSLGGFLALCGVVSSVLFLIGYNLRILMWMNNFGPTTGWLIRGGLIAGGAALFFIFGSGDDEDDEDDEKKKKKE